MENGELEKILKKFVDSEWDLISVPAKAYLDGKIGKAELLKAVKEADKECGSCGCELDPLYKRAIQLI
jgi:hypothetical protein